MNNLLVIGAGGHGRVVAESASRMGVWEQIAFLDDDFPDTNNVLDFKVIGKINSAPMYREQFSTVIVGIGSSQKRLKLLEWLAQEGFNIGMIIHPAAVVASDVIIDRGSVVFAGAVINTGSKIGIGCIVNTAASVDHDCNLADGVHVCPGVRLAGEVTVGINSWIGIGAAVIQQVIIGDNVVVGAGAVVINDIPAGWSVVGVPAKRIQTSKRKSDQDE